MDYSKWDKWALEQSESDEEDDDNETDRGLEGDDRTTNNGVDVDADADVDDASSMPTNKPQKRKKSEFLLAKSATRKTLSLIHI